MTEFLQNTKVTRKFTKMR